MLFDRHFTPVQSSYFLFGPRGTGKSTWLKNHYLDATLINLLKPEELRQYLARPERLIEIAKASKSKIIIIDEIQKAPILLNIVHDLIEAKQGWQFILTGSSARKLKKEGINLLAGRAIKLHMHPLMASEMQQQFSLEHALTYGLVPLIVDSQGIVPTLQAYIGLYLEEEVKAEGLVRNMGSFARFLEIASFSHGTILNVSNIARECSVSRKLIEGYLSILQDLMLSYNLPVFTKRAKRILVSHDKFYYFDVGIYKNLRATGILDYNEEINGPGLEGLVLQHLHAWNDYQGSPYKLYYWRTKHGVEIDFIIYGSDMLCALEVKHSSIVNKQDLKGLKIFLEDYPEATAIFLYRGTERMLIDNIICIPVVDFLLDLSPKAKFPC